MKPFHPFHLGLEVPKIDPPDLLPSHIRSALDQHFATLREIRTELEVITDPEKPDLELCEIKRDRSN